MRQNTTRRFALAAVLTLAIGGVHAHDGKAHTGGIASTANKAVTADFDIVHTKIGTDKNIAGHELTQVAAVSGVFVATAGSTIRAQFWNQSGSATVTGRFAVAKIGA